MKHITTSSGFECEIDEDVFNDFELLDAIRASDDDDPLAITDVANKLFDKATKRRLFDMHRNEKGRVDIPSIVNEIGEVMRGFAEGKK